MAGTNVELLLENRTAEAEVGSWAVIEALFRHAQGMALAEDALLQARFVEIFIDSEIERLLRTRNEHMAIAEQAITYEQAQHALWRQQGARRLAGAIGEVTGPYGLLGGEDAWCPQGGVFDLYRRQRLAAQAREPWSDENATEMAAALGLACDGQESAERWLSETGCWARATSARPARIS
ncbi:MAG: hypothetical protein HY681_02250 [Chloroflexi bacterium]|nr:hypothetical protein [Chloroflexota bacterium]